ncbi:MAG: site-specific integrase [Ruminiclostridium sp.]|nr:site-specific integrase [Ruminiclostridium sp.]
MANVTKRGNSYRIRVSCGYDVNGKQVFQARSWRPPENMTDRQIKKELERQIVLFEEECKIGRVTAAIKFQNFAEQWFDEYAVLNLRKTSLNRQRQLTKRVYAALGHLRLDKITSRDIQKFVNDLAVNGRNIQTGKPLSRKTVIHHLSLISSIFSYAVKMDMLSTNPCTKVTVPKGEKKEKSIYTIDEVKQLFELLEAAPLKYRAFFMLAIYGGFRRGEMLGLEWKDIDFDTRVVNIRRTSNYTNKNGTFTDTTKTKSSQRSIKLAETVINVLRNLKSEHDTMREELGNQWIENDRLFVQWNGKPMANNTPYTWLKRFTEKNGMRFCDVHSMRHFHASLLIFAGVDPATVSADLGHSAISTTTGIYVHMFQEAQARTSDVIANALDFSKTDKTEEKKAS